jgi:hypothetical protein
MPIAWPLADQKLEQELLDLVQSSQRKFFQYSAMETISLTIVIDARQLKKGGMLYQIAAR